MKKYLLLLLSLSAMLAISCKKEKTPEKIWALYDKDGNGYDTVKIGSQFWMKQNLNTSHYRNGDPIPQITSASIWASLTTGAWCWYNNDSATYAATYGKLYNWYAVNDTRGLAPEGWHVPSYSEANDLGSLLGGNLAAGGKLKETGTSHWASPNTDATNSSGFTALAGGQRIDSGIFFTLGESGSFWTSTLTGSPQILFLQYVRGNLIVGPTNIASGCSVRCIRN